MTSTSALTVSVLPADEVPGDDLLDVLADAFAYPDRAARRHRARETVAATATVVGRIDDRIVAAACVTVDGPPAGRGHLEAIGVLESARDHGIGRELLRRLLPALRLTELTAETDADAVGFYRRLGFAITSTGESRPGAERFACLLAVGNDVR